jgi:hypothetical protein
MGKSQPLEVNERYGATEGAICRFRVPARARSIEEFKFNE